jgi:hypothetical protein
MEEFFNSFSSYVPRNQQSLLQFAEDIQAALLMIHTKID